MTADCDCPCHDYPTPDASHDAPACCCAACPGCNAEPGEPCRPGCLSHVTDSNGQPLEQCHACGSTAWRWLDCETCPAGECPERVCIDCGASVGN